MQAGRNMCYLVALKFGPRVTYGSTTETARPLGIQDRFHPGRLPVRRWGLGNIWKFPYVTGENGGGIFVLVYLACVLLVGLPIMIAEILVGRTTQSSPVGAFKSLAGTRSPWVGMGWLGVVSAFILLSFYSVVAGWSLHYTWLSISGQLAGLGPDNVAPVFGNLHASVGANLFWHLIFMGLTIAVVFGGVSKGVERWSRILMPALLIMMLVLLGNSLTLDGFGKAVQFLFGFHQDKFTAAGALEALGHAFFSLSLGMGAMLTYGSYLRRRDDIVGASVTISALDTCIALVASLMLFPIIFSYGMEPAAGPGLVFISVPIALSQMPGTTFLATVFFALLVFAALTSAISMLEVATSYLIDQRGWQRRWAAVAAGLTTALVGAAVSAQRRDAAVRLRHGDAGGQELVRQSGLPGHQLDASTGRTGDGPVYRLAHEPAVAPGGIPLG